MPDQELVAGVPGLSRPLAESTEGIGGEAPPPRRQGGRLTRATSRRRAVERARPGSLEAQAGWVDAWAIRVRALRASDAGGKASGPGLCQFRVRPCAGSAME